MLGYREDAYPGNGIYVVDAITLLEHQAGDLSSHVVRLRPRGQLQRGDLGTFGWLPDGDIVNGTRAFALTAMGLYAIVGHWQEGPPWPEEVVPALGDVAWTGDIPEEVVAAALDHPGRDEVARRLRTQDRRGGRRQAGLHYGGQS